MTSRRGRAGPVARLAVVLLSGLWLVPAAGIRMASSFLNSLAVTLPAVAIPVVVAGTAAYAFAFLRSPAATGCSRWRPST